MSTAISPILMRYIGRRYAMSFGAIYLALLSVIYLIDSIELMKRLSKYGNFSFGRLLRVAAFKLPEVGLELLPFAVLIAAVFTFWRLTRTSELVVVRATGVSAWQFLVAPLLLAVAISCTKMMLLNPLGSAMLAHYEQLEAKYMSAEKSTINIAKTGLWLRQEMDDGRIAIIHAVNIKLPEWSLTPVTAYFFDQKDQMTHRIDGERAELSKGDWVFYKAWSNPIAGADQETIPQYFKELHLKSPVTIADIENRFASPRTISFWALPEYAHIMQNTGFEANPLWARFYDLLSEPLLCSALIFLAAALALRSPRNQRGWFLVLGTIFVGFIVFFLGDFLQALGISERLPLVVASFAPATISILMGLTALLYMEDG